MRPVWAREPWPAAPANQRTHSLWSPVRKTRETGEVAADVGGHGHADRRRDDQLQAAGQDPRDEEASNPPVPVGEGVDDLELDVGDGRLGDRVDIGPVDVGDQVLQERTQHVRRWGDQRGVRRVGTTDPPLLVADDPHVPRRGRTASHQGSVPLAELVDGELPGHRLGDRGDEGGQVGGDPSGGRV